MALNGADKPKAGVGVMDGKHGRASHDDKTLYHGLLKPGANA